MEALLAAELAADRPTRKGPVASSSTGMNRQRTGHGGPAGGGRFWRYSNYCYFCELEFKQLNHMKKDIEIGEYAAPECVVVPVMMKETVLAVSGGQLDEEEEPVF